MRPSSQSPRAVALQPTAPAALRPPGRCAIDNDDDSRGRTAPSRLASTLAAEAAPATFKNSLRFIAEICLFRIYPFPRSLAFPCVPAFSSDAGSSSYSGTPRRAQPLHRPPAHQVLRHNLFRILGLHVAVPHRLGIHHHRRPVLALVQAAGLVDPHLRRPARPRAQSCCNRVCSSLFPSRGAGRPRRIGGADVVADKNMAFKWGQAAILLSPSQLRTS